MSDDEQVPGTQPSGSRRATPFGNGIPLGRWGGVPILVHWSVAFTLLLFADLLATVELPAVRPGERTAVYWVTGFVTAVVFLLALLAHELTHALVARHYRIRVERISLWMLGGLTELDGQPPTPRADALIAVSGPLTSLGIGGLAAGLAWWLPGPNIVTVALAWLAAVNVLLGVFNLLPGAPLDGGRLLRAWLWRRYHDRLRAAEGADRAGRIVGFGLVGLGVLEFLAGAWAGLWLALIGWFIVAGSASERYAVRAERLGQRTVRSVMATEPATAPDWWTVQQFLDHLTPRNIGQAVFPLMGFDARMTGAASLADLDTVAADQRQTTRLREVRTRTPPLTVAPDALLSQLIMPLHLHGGVAIVIEDGHPVGVVTEADLTRAEMLADLGWDGPRPTNLSVS